MSKHSPLILLPAARQRYQRAQEACPHWDYESDGNCSEPCCSELADAQDAYVTLKGKL